MTDGVMERVEVLNKKKKNTSKVLVLLSNAEDAREGEEGQVATSCLQSIGNMLLTLTDKHLHKQ